MEIKRLEEAPQFTENVIDWINNEFGNETSRKFYQGIIEHSKNGDHLPITFVAVEEGALVGTVGVWRGDLLSRQELFPWLSALVVKQECRNKGIGQRLQAYVVDYCKEKGYKKVYLYTELIGYYEKSGWTLFDHGYEYMGNEVQMYKKSL